ncbi:glycine betaine ABC transporter substrate-binding protein [Cerasibacillus terrae]|uniref:Glycine betaine ABC transporter substrate-binding protein n=1 Tax=Cerasibacillus terrae TaxID=2498845 RepID=A0A5C8P0C6_9BACI|nr:glycine betaine ABC transporter substrate-binding protein [Cerasibacillus terrae]TXL66821.1 glycine betaine ABC transporter substrate-binding protein [Cerasibacillus terrae]
MEVFIIFKLRNFVTVVVLGILVLASLSACSSDDETSGDNSSGQEEAKTIDIGQINWAENIAVSNMWKLILEEKGYDVKLHLLDMGTIMAALENDELDVGLEVWLPIQDANYKKQYQDTVHISEETWYDNAKVGLVVPDYVEIDSVTELNDNKEMFEESIVGFDPGAGTMEVTEDLIEEYDLELELLPSSEPAMITEIKEAIKEEKPIVSPLWSPHRVFSEVDLKYLEDPKEVYGGVEKIHHATRLGFADDHPEVAEWLKNWKMDDDQIGSLMSYVAEAEKPIDGAKKWIEENKEVIDEWLTE